MSETILSLVGVDKFYGPIGKGVHAVKNINMDIKRVKSSRSWDLLDVGKHRP